MTGTTIKDLTAALDKNTKALNRSNHPSNKVSKDNVFKVFQIADQIPEITQAQANNLAIVATQAKNLVVAILNCAPDCADRSTAIRAVREAEMWARSAIELESEDD